MDIQLSKKQMETIAQMTADIIMKKINPQEQQELVNTKEAARILGVSEWYIRKIKDRFPHVKAGNNGQGRILFYKKSLLPIYLQ